MSQQHPYPSPPSINAPLHSPLRRQRVAQPPTLLTTSLANSAHHLGLSVPGNNGQTPISTTSLSSPFSAHSTSPYPASPAAGQSPMALRAPTSFSAAAPYNPQQWGRLGAEGSPVVGQSSTMASLHARQSSRQVVYAPRMQGPDEPPMGSPPPPYTADSNPSSADPASPETDFSHGTTPSSAATTMSPGGATITIGIDRRSPNTLVQTASPLMGSAAFPPPPPASGSRARSTSRNHADRLLSAMNLRSRNTTTSPTAMDTLQQNTQQLLNLQTPEQAWVDPSRPPAARRAASTGAIGSSYAPRSPLNEPSSALQEYGISLPPPPPGPPPATNRSQSLNRPSDIPNNHTARSLVPPRTRQPPGHGTALGPVPPTPADWRDEELTSSTPQPEQQQAWQPPLHIQTNGLSQGQYTESPASAHPGVSHVRRESGGLIRSPAVRNRSAKGLRERRSESRTGRHQGSEDSTSPDGITDAFSRPLADIVIGGESLAQRRASTRMTPRSAKNFQGLDEALTSADSAGLSGLRSGSARSTPYKAHFSGQSSPAFSPGRDANAARSTFERPGNRQAHQPSPSIADSSLTIPASNARPLSHLLHMPNDESVRVMPLSPESTQSLIDFEPESPKSFSARAAERHRIFLQKEANASSDEERLHLFTSYMIAESRIRREKYAAVFKAENIHPSDLLEGMFEEPSAKERVRESTIAPPRIPRPESAQESRRSSGSSFIDSQSQSQSRRPSTTATSEHVQQSLTLDTTVNDPRGKNFVPCLSPIQSMSAVTGRDETESRGRAPSRWWESQSNPSQPGDGFDVLKRSKRESKYMSAVIEDSISPTIASPPHMQSSSSQLPSYDAVDEYPPEKVGWHEPQLQHARASSHQRQNGYPQTPLSAPYTPDPRKLDISRLITLPPPYPRRHPAVNNSHPDLADIRAVVRALHEFPEAEEAKSSFESKISEKRNRASSWSTHQKSLHDQDMAFRMEHGEISQSEFDEAETALETKLASSRKDLAQATFDLYQSEVTAPIHPQYDARIARATSAFTALSNRLVSDSDTHSPNLAQEGGDEKPELLEKLTMLKWLFEARETLHRAQHDLLTVRNEYYRDLVLLPYSLPGTRNDAKRADAQSFFEKDLLRRRAAADKSALSRWRDFCTAIETHVTRGVEVQLSAFWDIAPSIQALLQRVPDRAGLEGFEILVPKQEVEENPAYWTHPLRYLYSVLGHVEASSRQFVESQVSLWCLLQEVREGVVGAKWRARESRRAEEAGDDGGGEGAGLDWREEREKLGEVQRGVDDLKEKVGVVEGQWTEGLGGEIGRVRESVRGWLEKTRGWDEELEEGE
ncbi:MAG: hypothetical protein MMC23_005938 [Stictis urceolatum]|nr:hypothetical protein [Stictis urceolata]